MERLQTFGSFSDEDRAFFDEKMREASAIGMNFREGLEYVICLRNGGSD